MKNNSPLMSIWGQFIYRTNTLSANSKEFTKKKDGKISLITQEPLFVVVSK